MAGKKDPYEGTLQYGVDPDVVDLLQAVINDVTGGTVPLSDQELLDIATIGYKMGLQIGQQIGERESAMRILAQLTEAMNEVEGRDVQ